MCQEAINIAKGKPNDRMAPYHEMGIVSVLGFSRPRWYFPFLKPYVTRPAPECIGENLIDKWYGYKGAFRIRAILLRRTAKATSAVSHMLQMLRVVFEAKSGGLICWRRRIYSGEMFFTANSKIFEVQPSNNILIYCRKYYNVQICSFSKTWSQHCDKLS